MAIRENQRGTMLVVILGLLVALFVIGTSFSYITLSERRSASNYLDRQRALDLAQDGVEYSIARLREEKTRVHYEYLDDSAAGMENGTLNADVYIRGLESENATVSWPKDTSSSSTSDDPDQNWVDLDGNGSRDSDEVKGGTDRFSPNAGKRSGGFPSTVTGFKGDGLNINQNAEKDVLHIADKSYGLSGTYLELGDIYRVRVVDAASLLNINNFDAERLRPVLSVLGGAIDDWVSGGNPTGESNPFRSEILTDFIETFENFGGSVTNKEQLRSIWNLHPNSDYLYNLAMKFITVNSWTDMSYRSWVKSNTKIDDSSATNPHELTDQQLYREGYSDGKGARDGWPEWQPDQAENGKAPVNINTAPYPVLVALFANITAKAPFLYYNKADTITVEDKLQKDSFGITVKRQKVGTTDFGRQNARTDTGTTTGIQEEKNLSPGIGQNTSSGSGHNKGIFQLVPIGPIHSNFGDVRSTSSSSSQGNEDVAVNLAREIIKMRAANPFLSWQDFDARFFRKLLLGLEIMNSGQTVPDLVSTGRSSIKVPGKPTPSETLLPRAENADHLANPFKSSDVTISNSNFKAWYWKCCVDMLRANFNPNNVTNRYNADYPYHQNVDRMDLSFATCPLCFSSMGVFEVVSQGEIRAPASGNNNEQATDSNDEQQYRIMARRQIRTTVQIYDVLRHTTQKDFSNPLYPDSVTSHATSSTPIVHKTVASHFRHGTKGYPDSFDENTNGSWDKNSSDVNSKNNEDSVDISYSAQNNPGGTQASDAPRSKWKGSGDLNNISGQFGYIGLDPKDRTPVRGMADDRLRTFHARFNESLNSRHLNSASSNPNGLLIRGNLSDVKNMSDKKLTEIYRLGKNPIEFNTVFDDFASTATPRSKQYAVDGGGGANANEFSEDFKKQSTTYSSLRPDGVYLHGGSLRQRATRRLTGTYNRRGKDRAARLKILRYPCGSHFESTGGNKFKHQPFSPISPYGQAGVLASGIDDTVQDGYTPPAADSLPKTLVRLGGLSSPFSGTDNHNKAVEAERQTLSNMPYYEGTVDFWIKWSVPPQGRGISSVSPNPVTVAMGEIDPSSHNFSGLFGATAFGRVSHTVKQPSPGTITSMNKADSDDRGSDADIEGVQFFVYKEPGGVFRFTRLYFSEAFSQKIPSGATSSISTTVTRFGSVRRLDDQANIFGGYTGSNDICPDDGSNKGFKYARTDAWVDLNTAQYEALSDPLILRVHDWYRFTLEYNSNTSVPYRLWINGHKVSDVKFHDDPVGDLGFLNDGSRDKLKGQKLPETNPINEEIAFYRRSSPINEINPEDRLTIGCIFRRQRDIADSKSWGDTYDEIEDEMTAGVTTKRYARPVFKFDSNFVAVANATIDDFRISNQMLTSVTLHMPGADIQKNSRYASLSETRTIATRPYFEHGFLPMNSRNNELHTMPVRLGTISWTEIRPDWDPYASKGLDMPTSARLRLEWAVYKDLITLSTEGKRTADLQSQKPSIYGDSGSMVSTNIEDDDYWARGGVWLKNAVLPSGANVGVLIYRFYFEAADNIKTNNVTAYLEDVTITVLTPPIKLSYSIDF